MFWKRVLRLGKAVKNCRCFQIMFCHASAMAGLCEGDNILETRFAITKGCVRMVDVLKMHFEFRKGCVTRLDVW